METLQIRFNDVVLRGYELNTTPTPRVDRAPVVSSGAVLPCFYERFTAPYEQLTATTARVTIEKYFDFLPITQAVGNRWVRSRNAPDGFMQVLDTTSGVMQNYTGGERVAVWGSTSTGLAAYDITARLALSSGFYPGQYAVAAIDEELQTITFENVVNSTVTGRFITPTITHYDAVTVKQNDLLYDVTPPRIVVNCHVEQDGAFPLQSVEFNTSLYIGARVRFNPSSAQQFTPYDFTIEI